VVHERRGSFRFIRPTALPGGRHDRSWHHRQSDPLEADARCLIGVIIERRSRMIYSGTTLRLTAPTRLTSPMSARRNIERRSCQCVPNRDSVQLLPANAAAGDVFHPQQSLMKFDRSAHATMMV
jgi:hypothetical protein